MISIRLRVDPAFKLACGRLPDTGQDLCSQPTLSRQENVPRFREAIRLTYALVDIWMDSYACAPGAIALDIDDTVDVVHGHQQLSLFNAYYDEHCFLPIYVYDTERSRPVAVILRPGKTPSGIEVHAHLRRLVRRIRRRWPQTHITFRGDSHYACPEAMSWCEHNGINYVFGLTGTKPLARKVDEVGVESRRACLLAHPQRSRDRGRGQFRQRRLSGSARCRRQRPQPRRTRAEDLVFQQDRSTTAWRGRPALPHHRQAGRRVHLVRPAEGDTSQPAAGRGSDPRLSV
jgi:hypothetical protein